MSNGLRLAEILAIRLCHDLSSPLGAMLGASGVAEDEPALAGEAMAIMADATQAMVRRIRLVRAAWGGPAPMSGSEFATMAASLATKRVAIGTDDLDPLAVFGAEGARVALNVLLLAVEALHGNGTVTIGGDPSGDIVFGIAGKTSAWPAGFIGLLADPDSAWTMLDDPAKLQAPLTVLLAQAAGLRISVLLGPNQEAAPPLLLRLS
ncbi:MAG: hypothetical protein H7251_15565 [Acetobacteraceae bacterium]|nr:hypothetical protein [Acetobacteraceae bacterium]